MEILATANPGLEETTGKELSKLGLEVLRQLPGIVSFDGTMTDCMKANLYLRSARRILLVAGRFEARSERDLYEGVRSLDWGRWIHPRMTFAVEAHVRNTFTGHSGYAALKVKDALADASRDVHGSRPNVDRKDPDVRVFLHLAGSKATLSVDSSGLPLHKRTYRVRGMEAPLNETLAAGILLLAGYDGSQPFTDPLCGSGTFPIEAALIARNVAPGLLRENTFAFQRWLGYSNRTWKRMIQEATDQIRNQKAPIAGSDRDPRCVEAARINAAEISMEDSIHFRSGDLETYHPGNRPGHLCTNLPYGERIGSEAEVSGLYRTMGDVLKHRAPGWTAHLLAGSTELAKNIALRPSRRLRLKNGPLECLLLKYEMWEGSRRHRA